jgi:hypothetical protein
MSEQERLGAQLQDTSFSTSSNQAQQGSLLTDNHPSEIIQRASICPGSLTSSDIMQLQNTIGNRAVCQLMQNLSLVQPSSSVKRESKPGDFLPPTVPSMQGLGAEPVQMQAENNTGLPDTLKAGVERLSGIDMSEVRVHYNSDKPAQLGALAYTQGKDIHVAAGQERHLPHEAWHVVQQARQQVQPTVQTKGAAVNDEPGLENEASEKGRQSLKEGENAEILGFGSIAQDSYKAAGGAEVIQKMNNGEEEEEKKKEKEESSGSEEEEEKEKESSGSEEEEEEESSGSGEEETGEELSEKQTNRKEAERQKAIRKFKFEMGHLKKKDSSGHGKGKKITAGSKADKHQKGQKRKTDRKRTLKGRVAEAAERLEELDVDPSKIKSASRLKKEKEQAKKKKKKEERKKRREDK